MKRFEFECWQRGRQRPSSQFGKASMTLRSITAVALSASDFAHQKTCGLAT
jgi:hypothetical protein